MQNGLKEIRKDALLNGLFLGGILLLIDIASLYVFSWTDTVSVVLLTYALGFIILPLLSVALLVLRLRNKVGGYWNLRQATSGIFITFLVAYLSSSMAKLFCFKLIPIATKTSAKLNFASSIRRLLEGIKAQPEKINEAVRSIEQQFDSLSPASMSVVLSNLVFLIIILFVASLLFAAIYKREPHFN